MKLPSLVLIAAALIATMPSSSEASPAPWSCWNYCYYDCCSCWDAPSYYCSNYWGDSYTSNVSDPSFTAKV
jgi:hypothetical protein